MEENKKRNITNLIAIILYDVITAIVSMLIATLIATDETETINYMYYLPYHIFGLTFLQIATYFILNIYKIDLKEIDLSDISVIAIANGVVLVCNVIYVLISGWFTILWAILYSIIMLSFSLGFRFIFIVKALKQKEQNLNNQNMDNNVDLEEKK